MNYYLGKKFDGIYFTQREADCMVHLLQGKSNLEIAQALNLSHRTVEYYLHNMRAKLFCRTRAELVEIVQRSDLIKTLESRNCT